MKHTENRSRRLAAARGEIPAAFVLKNATYLNVFTSEFLQGDIAIEDGVIVGIGSYNGEVEQDLSGKTVCAGFIDGHIHLESTLALPAEFARVAVPHGTTTVVTDPHEIANVMGTDGIEYILQATEGLPLEVQVMLPSCVPATPLDESGAELSAADLQPFYGRNRVCGLAEMMNYFGAVGDAPAVSAKLAAATAAGVPIDGHAPFLGGAELNAYVTAGVKSDHECCDVSDALEKIRRGQFILVREGTAAQNLNALLPLLVEHPTAMHCGFCTDDKHPDGLLGEGHIDAIIRKAIAGGVLPQTALAAASWNTAQHYGLKNKGAIAPGYDADLVVLSNLRDCCVERVWKAGKPVFQNGTLAPFAPPAVDAALQARARNTFRLNTLTADDLHLQTCGVIELIPHEIVTKDGGMAEGISPAADILEVACVERHKNTGHIGLAYLKGYGLKSGAVATSIAHDSHNIIAVGANEQDLAFAVNRIAENHGGIVVVKDGQVLAEVPLAVAGIISDAPLEVLNEQLEAAKAAAFDLGVSREIDPFMTLSFISLPVIPTLRVTTQGLFDATTQQYR